MENSLIRLNDLHQIVLEARARVGEAAAAAVAERGRFLVVLSGGSTPVALYKAMGEPEFIGGFPWLVTHFFWGDERWVKADSPRSNFRSAIESLPIDKIPAANLHPVNTELADANESAERYEAEMARFFGTHHGGFPVFDLVLLGLGEDGHVASLFPGDPAVTECKRRVVAATGPGLEPRVTMTLPLINAAREVVFLVSGEAKAGALRAAIRGDRHVPASLVKPVAGRITWLVDEAASGLLH